ncbi:DNA-processing protein DprA [Kutzneria buriramensis]|uniref:DNA processing protein n=1 Tax=Kutzneria buriramensis TaxID=1045776 RepID=A0A3E0HB71_9PSEU|nr:DNA-processing protein DprA [Kutzneria buriramensis]REH41294.1 DNA processing protein [Kutzneria buriramensis]
MTVDEIRLARAYLLRVAEPPAPEVVSLVKDLGAVRAAQLVRAGKAADDETAARRHLDVAAMDIEAARAKQARLVIPEDEEWPAWQLLALANAAARGVPGMTEPLGLWVRGRARLDALVQEAVAVIGARAATGYGEHVASEIAFGLAERSVTVVSGAAYGIDGCAHRGALGANGPTIAVLACGVDVAYPVGHTALLAKIADTGAVVSEYPPSTRPARHRFLVRNRLIAALAAGTVVVEAGRRSGSRNTAATTSALGRPLMAVPGPVTSAMSVGCHDLLRSAGATAVCSVEDVMADAGRIGVDASTRSDEPLRSTDGLDRVMLRVHEELPSRGGLSAERIAVGSGVPLSRVRALLPELELLGLVQKCEAGWCRGTG